jgi:hypothetical protein
LDRVSLLSSPHEILSEALRIARGGDIRRALQIILPLIPPGEDYGVELVSTPNLSYYIDRGGLISISKRLEEGIPYMMSTSRRIAWDLLPSWVLEEVDFCKILKDLARINAEWLAREGRAHPHTRVAREIASINIDEVCRE